MSNRTISIGFKFENGADGLRNLVMNAEDLRRALSATVIQAQNLNHSVINFGQLAQGMEAFKSALSGISSFLSSLSGDAEPFADAMQATNTMAGRDASGLEALKVEVTELAQRVPVAREALANGLYQVISNGVPEDNWISFLEASSRSAVGGIADLGQVVGVTSTIIKNYGLSWEQAVAVQDKIQLTAKNGVTSFEQLAASLPKVTANAATLGVSIDELMATFATLTGVSGNTAEVATQLAAVMTALVKPSSEAVKIAAQMGVQFDAAAVKAAGGFQQFLSSLDASVKAYAASSGVLEQEIYAKLFGSAEALRALIPLNGELASKFGSNVAEMKNSAGTMDAAFENMSKTGAAAAQSLKNRFVELFDFINEFGTSLKPFFEGIEVMSQLGASIKTVTEAVKTLNLFFIKTCTLKVGAFLTVISTQAGRAAIRTQGLGAAVRATTASTKGLTLALRALGGATAVGLLIWGITEAVTLLTSRTREARKAVDELSASQKQSARTADELKSAEEAYSSSAAEGLGAINKEIASLKALIEAKQDTGDAIRRLNREYGSIFGTYATAEQWLDTLTRKSQVYAASLGFQGKLTELGTQQAGYQVKQAQAKARFDEMVKSGTAYIPDSLEGIITGSKSELLTTEGKVDKNALLTDSFTGDSNEQRAGRYNYNSTRTLTQQALNIIIELEGYRKALAELADETALTAGLAAESAAELAKSLPVTKTASEDVKSKKGKKHNKTAGTPPPEGSIKYKEEQIRTLRTKLDIELDPEARQKLAVEIDRLQKEVDKMHLDAELPLRVADVTEKLSAVELDPIEVKADIKIDFEKQLAPMRKYMAKFGKTTTGELLPVLDGLRSMGSAIGNLGGLFDETGRSWANFAATTVSAIAEILPQLARLIGGHFAEAMAVGTASTAGLGFPAAIPAIAAIVASITSVMASVPKFAEGGIAYGPTLGLFGEYAGAGSNPEVVAPLDRLRGMIADVVVSSAHPETDSGSERIVSRLTETVLGLETVSRTIQRSMESVDEVMVSESVRVSQLMSELTHSVSRVSETFRDFETVRQAVVVPVMTLTDAGLEAVAASVPHFAAGGVIYGPTLGVMGEYAGAGSNPEVVAPLDRLRGIIDHTAGDTTPRNVTFTIEGSRLVGVIDNYMRVAGKSGRRFNF